VSKEEFERILGKIRWTEAESGELSKAMDTATEVFGYAGRDWRPRFGECGGKRSATPLWILRRPLIESAVAAALCRRTPKAGGFRCRRVC